MHGCELVTQKSCPVKMHNAILRMDLIIIFLTCIVYLLSKGHFFFFNLLLCEDIFLGYCHLDMRNLCIISDDTASSLQTCKEVLAILGEFLYLHLSSKINVLTNQNM